MTSLKQISSISHILSKQKEIIINLQNQLKKTYDTSDVFDGDINNEDNKLKNLMIILLKVDINNINLENNYDFENSYNIINVINDIDVLKYYFIIIMLHNLNFSKIFDKSGHVNFLNAEILYSEINKMCNNENNNNEDNNVSKIIMQKIEDK